MPLAMFKQLGLILTEPMTMRLLKVDRIVKKPMVILYDALVNADNFIFLAELFSLDYEVDFEVPKILGRPFLSMSIELANMK